MGYHPSCAYQTCSMNCCNSHGFCPEDYDKAIYGTDYTSCYHYYDEDAHQTPAKFGYIVFVSMVVVVALALYLRRKRNAMAQIQCSSQNQIIKEYGLSVEEGPDTFIHNHLKDTIPQKSEDLPKIYPSNTFLNNGQP